MMPHTPRIGFQIGAGDPFWVQVREVIWQRAQTLPVEIVEIDIERLACSRPTSRWRRSKISSSRNWMR